MSVAQVKNFMSELKLTGMSNIFEETVKDATENSWTHSEFLDVLLQSESDWREERKIKIRIKNSKLKMNSSFEDFDFTTNRSITKAQIKEIYTLKWIEQSRPLLLIGQTGVGKTFIAQAVGLHACEKGKLVLFMTVTTWMENLALARSSGTYLRFREKLIRPDVLILDDFGMRKLTATEAQDFCELLEERQNSKSTVMTTQLPLEHWGEVLPDPVIADAILDRVKHSALTFKITGKSYREVKAKKLDG